MYLPLKNLTDNIQSMQKDLNRYGLSAISNQIALDRIRKAMLAASEHIKNEQDLIDCKTSLYSSLQKMKRLGIDFDEVDLWFVSNYKKDVKADYLYTALLRSASKRGYNCLPTFEYILQDEKFSTYYGQDGRIYIDFRDEGRPKDIKLANLSDYRLFFLLLDIKDSKGKLIHQVKINFTPEEVLKRKAMSRMKDSSSSVWEKWTKSMIQKTLIISAFKVVKDVLPGFDEMFKFDDLDEETMPVVNMTEPVAQEIEDNVVVTIQHDLKNPGKELLEEAEKIRLEYKITPELVDMEKQRVMEGIRVSGTRNRAKMLINREAATILSLGESFINEARNAFTSLPAN